MKIFEILLYFHTSLNLLGMRNTIQCPKIILLFYNA